MSQNCECVNVLLEFHCFRNKLGVWSIFQTLTSVCFFSVLGRDPVLSAPALLECGFNSCSHSWDLHWRFIPLSACWHGASVFIHPPYSIRVFPKDKNLSLIGVGQITYKNLSSVWLWECFEKFSLCLFRVLFISIPITSWCLYSHGVTSSSTSPSYFQSLQYSELFLCLFYD